ncbi:MAG TPA: Hsp20/alpha crystallin family protein [Phycisphaerales bacterium]|nr:Hsp20/alpha crystallin family protein [Phycisphaerales bacterium]
MLNTLLPNMFPTDLDALSHQMSRLLHASTPFSGPGPTAPWPGINIWRAGDTIVAEAEIPGFRLDDVEVTAARDTVTIRGRRAPSAPENAAAIRVERLVTSFERSFQLPFELDTDAIEATLTDGVLRVTMPVAETARPRRVAIKALGAGDQPRAALPEGGSVKK